MRKIALLVVVFMVLTSVPVFAQCASKSACSDRASIHQKMGDWFATMGKSPEEREQVLAQRESARAEKKAEKKARKEAKQAEKLACKEAKQAGKDLDKGSKDAKKKGKKLKDKFKATLSK